MVCSLRYTRALFIICCVELLERLAGYLISVSLVFYLNEARQMSVSEANHLSGWVFGLSYVAAIGGGLLSDWRLGARATTLLGLVVLGIALLGVTMMQTIPLWLWGGVFVVGNGLFKPGIVSLLNAMLPSGHPRRSFGFTLFYVVANLGSACAPLLGAWAKSRGGWSGMSGAAGMGMALGAVVLLAGWRVFGDAPNIPHADSQSPAQNPPRRLLLPALILLSLAVNGTLYAQSTSTLLLWARDSARRDVMGWTIPPTLFATLPPTVVLIGAPLLAALRKTMVARGRTLSGVGEIGLGLAICGVSFVVMTLPSALNDQGRSSPLWLVLCKVTLTVGEMLVLPSALSLLGSLAPPQRSGLLSGLSFGAQALGFWVGGLLGARWEQWSSTTFFAVQSLLGIATAALVTFGAQVRTFDTHHRAQK